MITAPLWGLGALMFASVLLFPRPWGAWLVLPGVGLIGSAFLAAYRVPPPFLPAWLRDEFTAGSIRLARPTKSDWLVFWMVVPLFALSIPALVAIIVMFHPLN